MIKPAGKEGGIVILNRGDCEYEAIRQLSDEIVYKKISTDPTSSIQYLIKVTVQEALALD